MRIYHHILGLLLLILLTNCSMMKYRDYKELHEYEGSEKYEIITLVKPKEEVKQVILDSMANNLIVQVFYDPVKSEDYYSYTLKIDGIGLEVDSAKTNRILKNGTNWNKNSYSDWIINGDDKKYKYIEAITGDEKKNAEKWLQKFKELYEAATYVYKYSSYYYFKVDNKWYKLKNTFKEYANLKDYFPPKEDQDVRMIELEDHTPDFSRKAFQRDTSLWTYHGYEEADREEGSGLDPINFSAGWHYLQLKMPGSEPLKIKRYGSMGVNLHTYIIPDSLGGREDVVFIVQEPSSLYPDREHGGMYVVRPREL